MKVDVGGTIALRDAHNRRLAWKIEKRMEYVIYSGQTHNFHVQNHD
jgi:hypothetical protein